MAEVSKKVAQLTDTEILRSFREALMALLPILKRLDCISDDAQPYDPFDRVAEALWEELVLESLRWKYGIQSSPHLAAHGFFGVPAGPDGFVEVRSPSSEPFRFIQFLGDRSISLEPFNAVQGVSPQGLSKSVPFDHEMSFAWVRPRHAGA